MNNVAHIFKDKKLKLTPQRYAIYNYLKSVKTHPTAEMIYNALINEYPTMSLATVYKTLKTLKQIGLVEELNVGEDNFRYDANTHAHPHIVCLKCGRVDDIEDANFDIVKEKASEYSSYDIKSYKIYFYGICPKCRKDKRA